MQWLFGICALVNNNVTLNVKLKRLKVSHTTSRMYEVCGFWSQILCECFTRWKDSTAALEKCHCKHILRRFCLTITVKIEAKLLNIQCKVCDFIQWWKFLWLLPTLKRLDYSKGTSFMKLIASWQNIFPIDSLRSFQVVEADKLARLYTPPLHASSFQVSIF